MPKIDKEKLTPIPAPPVTEIGEVEKGKKTEMPIPVPEPIKPEVIPK